MLLWTKQKDSLFNKSLAKKVDQNENLLVFQIDSVINVTKKGETKIYKAVQELKNLVKQNNGNERSSDRSKTSEQSKFADKEYYGGQKKMEENLDFFFNNNASQPKKKKMQDEKNKIVQHDTNKITKLLD